MSLVPFCYQIFLHILLLSLLVLGSNYNNVEIIGGGEGDEQCVCYLWLIREPLQN